jgi:hypothetical protein
VRGTEGDDTIDGELMRHQVETRTEPATDLADIRAQLVDARRRVGEAARETGAAAVATGTAPFGAGDVRVSPKDRYRAMVDEFGETSREAGTCGMHVHVGIASREEGIGIIDRMRPWLPLVLALSVNSPYAEGRDSGYASWRSQVWCRWPTAGATELFGDPHRWSVSAQRMHWTSESLLVPSFRGSTQAEIEVLCNYDVELAAAKFFHSVTEGEVPLAFHFNGSVYYSGGDDRLQVVQVPWDTSVNFAMPISVWKDMIDSYYPFRGWIPVHRDTLDSLQRLKARVGAPTLDAAVTELLARESFDE